MRVEGLGFRVEGCILYYVKPWCFVRQGFGGFGFCLGLLEFLKVFVVVKCSCGCLQSFFKGRLSWLKGRLSGLTGFCVRVSSFFRSFGLVSFSFVSLYLFDVVLFKVYMVFLSDFGPQP